MWFLVFIVIISAAAGTPVRPSGGTQDLVSGNMSAVVEPGPAVENVTGEQVGGSWTVAQNQSVPAVGCSGNNSAETMEELENPEGTLEGDILLSEDRNAVQTLWQDAVLFYSISDDLAHRRKEVLAALDMISSQTCVRFQERSDQLNYVYILNGKGCASRVGCQGGVQPLFFGPPCSVGNLVHELVHALGMFHEHVRLDRDRYVNIHWDRIKPGKRLNFQVREGNLLQLPYDLDSIMHYGPYFFSVDGEPTMLPRRHGVQIGQRKRLSRLDVQKLNALYHCRQRNKSG